jgi:hypothetical protein
MAGVRQQSVYCGVLQLHEAHILHAAATRVLQWIHVQQNLSSIAAVDVAAALKHTIQITSCCAQYCVSQYSVHNMMLVKTKLPRHANIETHTNIFLMSVLDRGE